MITKEEAKDRISKIIERFDFHIEDYKKGSYNETQTRNDYINPFFEALGWDINNKQGLAESYREVIHEDKVKVAGKTKAPDYCFTIYGQRKFFVEAKKPSVHIKESIEPAYQLRRYGWSAKMPISIITDFEEFSIYDCTIKPAPQDKASVARIKYITFNEYIKEFDFLWDTFSKEMVLKGSFDKFISSNKGKKGTSEVDKELLKLIEGWRNELAKNIALRNNELDIYNLNLAVQKIIDRIIFMRIAEDKEIEPYEALFSIAQNKDTTFTKYQQLDEIFIKANKKYNAGLFLHEKWLSEINIDDKVFSSIIKELYYPECPYEFSIIPIEILGNIYEQFLGKTIKFRNVRDGHTVIIEEKPEVRKAGGVYYTPQYIVDYIVKNTIGKVLGDREAGIGSREPGIGNASDFNSETGFDKQSGYASNLKKNSSSKQTFERNDSLNKQEQSQFLISNSRPLTPEEISKIKICDPACGSGSFLVGAYQYLLNYHLNYYTLEKNLKRALKENKIYQVALNDYKLTIEEKQNILTNNIYGVDIDPQATQVTKLSLYLKLLENEGKEAEDVLFRHTDLKLLPDLENNIKCGNSLIGSDFYDDKDIMLFGNEEMRKINVFDWEKEFPKIFSGQDAGFDIVIGNPPYVNIVNVEETQRHYLKKKYTITKNKVDLYAYFIEIIIRNIMGKNAVLGYIVSSSWIAIDSFKPLRKLIFSNGSLNILCIMPNGTFEDACVETVIMVYQKNANYKHIDIFSYENSDFKKSNQIDIEKIKNDINHIIMIDSSPEEINLLNKIEVNSKLGDYLHFSRGVKTSNDKRFVFQEQKNEDCYKLLRGKNIQKYSIEYADLWLWYRPDLMKEKVGCLPHTKDVFFADEKIILQGRSGKRLIACYDNEKFFVLDTAYFSKNKNLENHSIKYFLSLINSKLINFWYSSKFKTPTISGYELHQIPVKKLNISDPAEKTQHDRLVSLVDSMLEAQKQHHVSTIDADKKLYKQKIDILDKQIDSLVYQLYKLTEEEIKIVEGE